ncbi:MAG: peptidylprolyl isomerase [Christensenellales bacterium]|jgi:parvulin-like peptidyl-prolyl isomerase
MKKWLSLLLCTALFCAIPCFAEGDLQSELDAANARIAELERELEDANSEIEYLTALLEYYEENAEIPEDVMDEGEFGDELSDEDGYADEEPAPVLKEFGDADVIATVNGEAITFADIRDAYEYFQGAYGSFFDMTDPGVIALMRDEALHSTLRDRYVNELAQEYGVLPYSEEKLAELAKQAQADYEEMLEYYKEYFRGEGMDEEQVTADTEAYLAENGLTREKVAENLIASATYDDVSEYATRDIAVTDDEVRAYYQSFVDESKETYASDPYAFDNDAMGGATVYYIPAGYRAVKQILIAVDDADEILSLEEKKASGAITDEEKVRYDELTAQVAPKLEEIMGRVAAGEDFDTLMAQYNEDPGMMEGSSFAQTGYYVSDTTETFEQSFKDAAMALKNVGDVSEPTLGSYGYYIIQYYKDLPEGAVELTDEDFAVFKADHLENAKATAFSDMLDAWTEALEIVYTDGFLDTAGAEQPAEAAE